MNKIQQEYNKAMNFIEGVWDECTPQEKQGVVIHGVNDRWLRNEANMWESYTENPDYILNGINYDPLHPDNLSAIVIKDFMDSPKREDIV